MYVYFCDCVCVCVCFDCVFAFFCNCRLQSYISHTTVNTALTDLSESGREGCICPIIWPC